MRPSGWSPPEAACRSRRSALSSVGGRGTPSPRPSTSCGAGTPAIGACWPDVRCSAARLLERALQASREVLGAAHAPTVHEHHAGGLPIHVLMVGDGDDELLVNVGAGSACAPAVVQLDLGLTAGASGVLTS